MNQIKQVLFILFAAVFGGFLLAFALIWFYGPTGQYKAGQSILSPEVIEQINFKDIHPKTGQSAKFIFDQTEFVYFDFLMGKWNQKPIPKKAYEGFYNIIKSDSSLNQVDEPLLKLFQQPIPTALITTVRTEVLPTAKAFQVIQFVKDDYYRVKLHGYEDEGKWAYFYQKDIYKNVMNLFTQQKKL